MAVDIIDGFCKKIFLQHSGGPGKGPESARTFRASQVTTGGRFKGNGNRESPLYGLIGQTADIKTAQYLQPVPYPGNGKFTE